MKTLLFFIFCCLFIVKANAQKTDSLTKKQTAGTPLNKKGAPQPILKKDNDQTTKTPSDEEKFEERNLALNVVLVNKCSNAIYYLVEEGGSTLHSSLGSSSNTSSLPSLKKGDKIWLSDENRNKTSLIFEATHYRQHGNEVFLCN